MFPGLGLGLGLPYGGGAPELVISDLANPVWSATIVTAGGTAAQFLQAFGPGIVVDDVFIRPSGWIGTRTVTTEALDLITGVWAAKANMEAAVTGGRHHFPQCRLEVGGIEYVYCFMGEKTGANDQTATIERYRLDTNAWDAKSSSPVARARHGAALDSDENDVYTFGGRTGAANVATVRRYSADDDAWSANSRITGNPILDMPVARTFMIGAFWDGVLHVLVDTTLYTYDMATDGPWVTEAISLSVSDVSPTLQAGPYLYVFGIGQAVTNRRYDCRDKTIVNINSFQAGVSVRNGLTGRDAAGVFYAGCGTDVAGSRHKEVYRGTI